MYYDSSMWWISQAEENNERNSKRKVIYISISPGDLHKGLFRSFYFKFEIISEYGMVWGMTIFLWRDVLVSPRIIFLSVLREANQ